MCVLSFASPSTLLDASLSKPFGISVGDDGLTQCRKYIPVHHLWIIMLHGQERTLLRPRPSRVLPPISRVSPHASRARPGRSCRGAEGLRAVAPSGAGWGQGVLRLFIRAHHNRHPSRRVASRRVASSHVNELTYQTCYHREWLVFAKCSSLSHQGGWCLRNV